MRALEQNLLATPLDVCESSQVSWRPHLIVIGRAEIESTALGVALYEHDEAVLAKVFAEGIDWALEGVHPLHGALYAGRGEVVRRLIAMGSPIDDSAYAIAQHHHAGLLAVLPPRPELVASIRAKSDPYALAWAIVERDVDTVRRLLNSGTSPNEPTLISHGMGERRPLHYAARRADIGMMTILLDAGADPNGLTPEGRSTLRLIAENEIIDDVLRRSAEKLLESRGAAMVPPLQGLCERWTYRLGWKLGSVSP